ncbi:hypothetical protein IWX76_001724 [Pedobacter sp. CAN_A7]|uniref:DUF4153 domain-containing protein n=1 Tax=Pedobacter sp. CAN_A7 TaxID=2787722 RepID=UPI0018CBB032
MRILSLDSIFQSTKSTVIRFPLAVAAVLLAMVACFYTIHLDGQTPLSDHYWKLAFISNIAFVALLSADLYAESNQWKPNKQWALRMLVLVFCVAIYFSLQPRLFAADWFRIVFFIVAFHLSVSYSAFLHEGNLNGFWEFNKILLLRILTAAFYAAVLFGGLSVALLAIDQLFNVEVKTEVYLYMLTVIGIGFTTFFFMGGLPANFKALNAAEPAYPKGLKIFTQYVLTPLMVVYLGILLIYEVTILMAWELPKGTVSMLILSYAVAGLLAVLLIYPVKEHEENRWFRHFSKFIFIMMIPLLVLLMLAIWERIRNYGITEPRYILIVLAIWLAIITAYFLSSSKQNIRIIPISLSVLAFLATFGPQSAASVSRYSQIQRFEHFNAAKDNKGMLEKRRIIHYLVTHHGISSLQPFAQVDLSAIEKSLHRKSVSPESRYAMEAKLVDTAYHIFKVDNPLLERTAKPSFLAFGTDKNSPLSVKGFDYLIPINDTQLIALQVNGKQVSITQQQKGKVVVTIGHQAPLTIDISGIVKKTDAAYQQGKLQVKPGREYYMVQEEDMRKNLNTDQYTLELVLTDLFFNNPSKRKDDFSYRGYLMIKIK